MRTLLLLSGLLLICGSLSAQKKTTAQHPTIIICGQYPYSPYDDEPADFPEIGLYENGEVISTQRTDNTGSFRFTITRPGTALSVFTLNLFNSQLMMMPGDSIYITKTALDYDQELITGTADKRMAAYEHFLLTDYRMWVRLQEPALIMSLDSAAFNRELNETYHTLLRLIDNAKDSFGTGLYTMLRQNEQYAWGYAYLNYPREKRAFDKNRIFNSVSPGYLQPVEAIAADQADILLNESYQASFMDLYLLYKQYNLNLAYFNDFENPETCSGLSRWDNQNNYYDLQAISDPQTCLFGLQDADGRWLITPRFQDIKTSKNEWGTYSYFTNGTTIAKYQGKYGITDACLNWVITPRYDDLERSPGEELYTFYDHGKSGLVDSTGKEVLPAVYSSLYYLDSGLYRFTPKYGGRSGVISSSGKVIIEAEYDGISLSYPSGKSLLLYKSDKIRPQYRDKTITEYVTVMGVADFNGRIMIPPVYDDIVNVAGSDSVYQCISYHYKRSASGLFVRGKQRSSSILNKHNKRIIPDSLRLVNTYVSSWEISNPSVFVAEGKKYKYLFGYNGTQILPHGYDDITVFSDSLFWVFSDTLASLFEVTPEARLLGTYEDVNLYNYVFDTERSERLFFSGEKNIAVARRNGLYGVIGNDRTELLPFTFRSVDIQEYSVIVQDDAGYYLLNRDFTKLNEKPMEEIVSLYDRYVKIKQNGLYGISFPNLENIAPVKYERIGTCISNGQVSSGICGIIHDTLSYPLSLAGDPMTIPNSHLVRLFENHSYGTSTWINLLTDSNGRIIRSVTASEERDEMPIDERFAFVTITRADKKHTGLSDSDGRLLIPATYTSIERYVTENRKDTFYVCSLRDDLVRVLNAQFKTMIDSVSSAFLLRGDRYLYTHSFKKGKRLTINIYALDGKRTLSVPDIAAESSYSYDNISWINDTMFITRDVAISYSIWDLGKGRIGTGTYSYVYHCAGTGMLIVYKGSKAGMINLEGKTILPALYADISYDQEQGLLWLKKGDYWAMADNTGKLLTPFIFTGRGVFNLGTALIYMNDSIRLISNTGADIIPPSVYEQGFAVNAERLISAVRNNLPEEEETPTYDYLPHPSVSFTKAGILIPVEDGNNMEPRQVNLLEDKIFNRSQQGALLVYYMIIRERKQSSDKLTSFGDDYVYFARDFARYPRSNSCNVLMLHDSVMVPEMLQNMIPERSAAAFGAYFYSRVKALTGIGLLGCPVPGGEYLFFDPEIEIGNTGITFHLDQNVSGTSPVRSLMMTYEELKPYTEPGGFFARWTENRKK